MLAFAEAVHLSPDLPVDVRARISKDALTASIRKTNFYAARPANAAAPAYGSYSYHARHSEESRQLEGIKTYVKTCLTTENAGVVPVIMEKIANLDGLSVDVSRRRAKEIFLPLISYIAEELRSRPAIRPVPDLHGLCLKAISLYLDDVTSNPKGLTRADVSFVIQAVVTAGQPELLLTTYVYRRICRLNADTRTESRRSLKLCS